MDHSLLFLFLFTITVSSATNLPTLLNPTSITFHPISQNPVDDLGSGGNFTFTGIAKYYDNRKCAVTSSMDDIRRNTSKLEGCLNMLSQKKIFSTLAVVTGLANWTYLQHWLNQNYTEVASHSRGHVHIPYTGKELNGEDKISYEWQIQGSRRDIIGNLTLPSWWRYRDRSYVYVWIDPYGNSDSEVRHWLDLSSYIIERSVTTGSVDFSNYNPNTRTFDRTGYTLEMGSPPWGGLTSVSSLNVAFDNAYANGEIYHFITHPEHVDWSKGGYADQHTSYISGRRDIWYVPLGPLYLYHLASERNIINTTFSTSGGVGFFSANVSETNHVAYGFSYPLTYVFDVPNSWNSSCVYYRYRAEDPWTLLASKTSNDYFNGINCARLDSQKHKEYVSIAFSGLSNDVYLQIWDPKMIELRDSASQAIEQAQVKVDEFGIPRGSETYSLLELSRVRVLDARGAFSSGNYSLAIGLTSSVSSYIDQAKVSENEYFNQLRFVSIVIVVMLMVLILICIMRLRIRSY